MPETTLSPLAPEKFPDIPAIGGVRVATRACGVKYKGRTDVLLAELAEDTQVAGVFTKSLTASAPVEWCRKSLPGGIASGLIVNSGNANAFTGRLGDEAVEQVVEAVADRLACRPSRTAWWMAWFRRWPRGTCSNSSTASLCQRASRCSNSSPEDWKTSNLSSSERCRAGL